MANDELWMSLRSVIFINDPLVYQLIERWALNMHDSISNFQLWYAEGTSKRIVGAACSREFKCYGLKPLPLVTWVLHINRFFNFNKFTGKLNIQEEKAW
jgi:hypothetical protein